MIYGKKEWLSCFTEKNPVFILNASRASPPSSLLVLLSLYESKSFKILLKMRNESVSLCFSLISCICSLLNLFLLLILDFKLIKIRGVTKKKPNCINQALGTMPIGKPLAHRETQLLSSIGLQFL